METFQDEVKILRTNSPLYVRCRFNENCSAEELCNRAQERGILLIPANLETQLPEIALSVATVGQNRLSDGVKMLEKVVKNSL